jgi:hypothetical protein
MGNIIGQGTSSGIIIGALLERLETQYDDAKDQSDDAKAKIKKVCDRPSTLFVLANCPSHVEE